MAKKIEVSHVSGEKPGTLVSDIKELLDAFSDDCFEDAFQKRTALERLIISGGKTSLSMDCRWKARVVDSRRGKKDSAGK